LHAILQAQPSDPDALHSYAEHFRQRGAWRELSDVLEFALNHELSTGAAVSELLPRLEEVAVIAETKLGDIDRALTVWRRMFKLDPSYQRAREACKPCWSRMQQPASPTPGPIFCVAWPGCTLTSSTHPSARLPSTVMSSRSM
jgi:hypothetical protein